MVLCLLKVFSTSVTFKICSIFQCSPKLTRKSKASGVAQRDSPKVGKKLPGSPKVAKKSSNPDAPKVAKKSSADSLKSAKKSSLDHTKTRKVADASEEEKKLEKSETVKQTADAKVPDDKKTEKAQPTKVAPNKSDEQMPESRKEEKESLRVDRPKLSVVGRQNSIHEDASNNSTDKKTEKSHINDPVSNATPKVTVR